MVGSVRCRSQFLSIGTEKSLITEPITDFLYGEVAIRNWRPSKMREVLIMLMKILAALTNRFYWCLALLF